MISAPHKSSYTTRFEGIHTVFINVPWSSTSFTRPIFPFTHGLHSSSFSTFHPPKFQAPPSPPSPPFIPPKFQAPPSPPSAPSVVPKFQAPPSPPSFVPTDYSPPSPPSPYRSSPSPPLPKSKFASSKSGALTVTGAIALFFFLLWVGVALYRRHQRRRPQCSHQGGDSPDVNAEGVHVPVEVQLAELPPLISGFRQWEEHEERPLASSGRRRSEIEEELPPPPASSLSPHSPLPSAPPLPGYMSELASPVSTRPPAPRSPQPAE